MVERLRLEEMENPIDFFIHLRVATLVYHALSEQAKIDYPAAPDSSWE